MVDLELAERFGWPPSVSDEQDPQLVDWLLAVARARDEVRAQQHQEGRRGGVRGPA